MPGCQRLLLPLALFVYAAGAAPGMPDSPSAAPRVVHDVWFDAVAENRYAQVKGMLDAGFEVRTPQRVTKLTALHFAAGGGSGETLAMLLWHGADVDATDTVKMTPLHHACELGQTTIAQVLLAHGADVNRVGGVHGYTSLHLAVQNGHTELAAALVALGADLNARERHGATPLHFAVLHGRVAAAEKLIDLGADVADVTTDDGYTPLHLAALRGHAACAAMLLRRGAALGARDREGLTSRQRAVAGGAHEVVRVLRAAGGGGP